MLVLRPVEPADLAPLQLLARDSTADMSSLPDDRERLRAKIADSRVSFSSDVQAPGGQSYLFVLEDPRQGTLLGCSEILATTGFTEPFYSLRNRRFTSTSREFNIEHGVQALSLCHDLSGHTLLRAFHIDSAWLRKPPAELLSRARLLFMAAHARRFAEAVVSEMVGYSDSNGQSPFWDAVGKHFFDLPYAEAKRLCGPESRRFLAGLMPQYPIYLPMLPQAAQDCVGRVHPDAQEAFDILQREGFETSSYVDLFDGGPTLYARTAQLRSIARSVTATARYATQIDATGHCLVSNEGLEDFRAIIAERDGQAGQTLALTAEMLAALRLNEGDPVRWVSL